MNAFGKIVYTARNTKSKQILHIYSNIYIRLFCKPWILMKSTFMHVSKHNNKHNKNSFSLFNGEKWEV